MYQYTSAALEIDQATDLNLLHFLQEKIEARISDLEEQLESEEEEKQSAERAPLIARLKEVYNQLNTDYDALQSSKNVVELPITFQLSIEFSGDCLESCLDYGNIEFDDLFPPSVTAEVLGMSDADSSTIQDIVSDGFDNIGEDGLRIAAPALYQTLNSFVEQVGKFYDELTENGLDITDITED